MSPLLKQVGPDGQEQGSAQPEKAHGIHRGEVKDKVQKDCSGFQEVLGLSFKVESLVFHLFLRLCCGSPKLHFMSPHICITLPIPQFLFKR